MSKIAIVIDSTAYLPQEIIEKYGMTIIPLQVIWGEETYQDLVDIQPAEFYERLKTAKVMPTTSQPSPASFKEVYARLLEAGKEIISIHISAKFSGTLDSAYQAREMLPKGSPIEIVDSLSTSMAMGFTVMAVAQAAEAGASLAECKTIAEQASQHTGVYFVVDTLEFLHRGGRIGGGAAFLGTMLDLKPILGVIDGRIEAIERVRSKKKAIDRLLEIVDGKVKNDTSLKIAVIHTNVPTEATAMLERVRQRFNASSSVENLFITDVSPVIGTHTGPGVVGLAYLTNL